MAEYLALSDFRYFGQRYPRVLINPLPCQEVRLGLRSVRSYLLSTFASPASHVNYADAGAGNGASDLIKNAPWFL